MAEDEPPDACLQVINPDLYSFMCPRYDPFNSYGFLITEKISEDLLSVAYLRPPLRPPTCAWHHAKCSKLLVYSFPLLQPRLPDLFPIFLFHPNPVFFFFEFRNPTVEPLSIVPTNRLGFLLLPLSNCSRASFAILSLFRFFFLPQPAQQYPFPDSLATPPAPRCQFLFP